MINLVSIHLKKKALIEHNSLFSKFHFSFIQQFNYYREVRVNLRRFREFLESGKAMEKFGNSRNLSEERELVM